jgi:hypothetical protein
LTFGPIPEGYQVDHRDDDSLNDKPDNLQLLDSNGNPDKEANREGTRVCRFRPFAPALDSNGQIDAECFEPDERPFEIIMIDPYAKIDDAVEEQDWRISITHDLKVGVLRWWQAARRWFDVKFLGFR